MKTLLRFAMLWGTIALSCLILTTAVSAQDSTPDAQPALPRWVGEWQPPEQNENGWDWVRLKSNEWAKGEIIIMRDFSLEFDSDEFGLVDFDWEDVAEIITERVYVIVLEDLDTAYEGTMTMKGDLVSVKVGDRIETIDRTEILAITPGDDRELNLWSMRASAGLGLRSGNTDESELTGSLRAYRDGRRTRLGFRYDGVYESLDNKKNTNNHRGRASLDYFLTRDLFLRPASFEVFTDEFKNVAYRLTPSSGFGYYLVRDPKLDWETQFAAGYQHVRTDSVSAGDGKKADNGALLIGTSIDAELSSDIDLILLYQLQVTVPDTEQTNHHAEATLEIELTSIIDFDLRFVWDRIEEPEQEADGSRPDTDDFRLSAGFGIEF